MAAPKTSPKLAAALAAGLVFSSAGLMAFLGNWEEGPKRQLVVYADKLAGNLPTVCKGLTRHITDTPIIVGERWTEAKCEAEERRAVAKVQTQIIECFEAPPPQAVFDAAASFAWNVGSPAACNSQAMKAWRQSKWLLGCRRMIYSDGGKLVWVYAQGKLVPGLKNRREAERQVCEGRAWASI